MMIFQALPEGNERLEDGGRVVYLLIQKAS